MQQVLIIGAGIGGLTLALSLNQVGIPCVVYEATPAMLPVGLGINILPHGARELAELGLEAELARVGVETRELVYCNRFGQLIHRDPRGRHGGYPWPQFSLHRADLQSVLIAAVHERLGRGALQLGRQCIAIEQDASGATAHFADGSSARGDVIVGCDGLHSRVRAALHPHEGPLCSQGIHMWRGLTRRKPFLTGASMAICGWLATGKLVAYPIRDQVDEEGNQLINWVAEIQLPGATPSAPGGSAPGGTAPDREFHWNRPGRVADLLPRFAGWCLDWLDVPALFGSAEMIIECPMVDREPLAWWTQGRVTLLGDAAHPMYPRGSNGGGQAILDARALAGCLKREPSPEAALLAYQALRLAPANQVVIGSRSVCPDTILGRVYERNGDRPFERIEDVIAQHEILEISNTYKRLAGFERESLISRGSLL